MSIGKAVGGTAVTCDQRDQETRSSENAIEDFSLPSLPKTLLKSLTGRYQRAARLCGTHGRHGRFTAFPQRNFLHGAS
jgi:hypothetical protein